MFQMRLCNIIVMLLLGICQKNTLMILFGLDSALILMRISIGRMVAI